MLELSKSGIGNLDYSSESATQLLLYSGMTVKALSLILIVAFVGLCIGSPLSPSESRMEKAKVKSHEKSEGERPALSHGLRMERLAHLPEDQRQYMSKQILQALSEIIQRDDCFSDYQGWVDFGRRNTD